MSANLALRFLRAFLVVTGLVMLPAFGAMVMPLSWMDAAHARLGLGQFPPEPIAEYLARSTSGLYGLLGVLFLLAASDVRKYAVMARVLVLGTAALAAAVGALMVGRLPLWWPIMDIASSAACAAALLILQRLAGVCGANSTSPES